MRTPRPEPIQTHFKGLLIGGTLDSRTGKISLNPAGMTFLLRPKASNPPGSFRTDGKTKPTMNGEG